MTAVLAAVALWFFVTPEYGEYPTGRMVDCEITVGEKTVRRTCEETMVFDEKSVKAVVRDFYERRSNGETVNVDVDHRDGTSVGTVDKMVVSPKGQIAARIVLNDEGMKAYLDGKYSGMSPAFWSARPYLGDKGRPRSITSVAVTNRPWIKTLKFRHIRVDTVP